MFKKFFLVFIAFMMFTGIGFSEKAPQKIYDLADSKLAEIGSDPIVVQAVKAQNAKNMTLDQIKSIDEKWKKTPGLDDFMKSILNSELAVHLRKIQNQKQYYAEIFAMDNKGANVAMTDKTSDYWQGDEAKFQKSFSDGKGMVFVDEVEYDESTQTYLVQVSVPVVDIGKVIGAVTFGIDIDHVE